MPRLHRSRQKKLKVTVTVQQVKSNAVKTAADALGIDDVTAGKKSIRVGKR